MSEKTNRVFYDYRGIPREYVNGSLADLYSSDRIDRMLYGNLRSAFVETHMKTIKEQIEKRNVPFFWYQRCRRLGKKSLIEFGKICHELDISVRDLPDKSLLLIGLLVPGNLSKPRLYLAAERVVVEYETGERNSANYLYYVTNEAIVELRNALLALGSVKVQGKIQ